MSGLDTPQIEQQPLPEDRIMTLSQFEAIRDPEKNYSLVTGSFDLMHPSHLQAINSVIKAAPDNSLVVGLDTDGYVERRKGKLTILPFEIRALQLATILDMAGVDGYIIGHEPESRNFALIQTVKPKLMMYSERGGRVDDIALVRMLGGEAYFLERGSGVYEGSEISSSRLRLIIRDRINEREG